ncbi:hypothetical protein B0A48_08379 [Cryoendolithus antarcticus]|uniref:SH3 domain-containing protein n=1 Tax=Cryoendolithus antarcticus TaxID=1507870 RepID=A0A1V8T5M2_9PEZI|nr:hypothetical protein B0A48_08379 [Cryoendolithus antarcticus]
MANLQAPEARPLSNATQALEQDHAGTIRRRSTPQQESRIEDEHSDGPDVPAVLGAFVRALWDYKARQDGELSFKKGNVLEVIGSAPYAQWKRGRVYSGDLYGRTGIFPENYVEPLPPIDAPWKSTKEDVEPPAAAGSSSIPGLVETLRSKPLDGIRTPPPSERPCMAYLHGNCQKGDACDFSHDLTTTSPRICPAFEKDGCNDHDCTLLHVKFNLSKESGVRAKAEAAAFIPELRVSSQSPAAKQEPIMQGSIARQDSNLRADLLLPGSANIPIEYSTIDSILQNNPNYGPRTRPYLPSASAGPHQRRENKQPTPPLPSDLPASDKIVDEPADIEARCRQLRAQLFDAGKSDLFYTLTRSHDSSQPKTSVLNVAALQHMALHQLQYDIACYVGLMFRTSTFYMELQGFPPLTDLMNRYCDAVRNLDYMRTCAQRGYEEDPFLMKSSRALERNILETTKLIPNHVLPVGPLPLPKDIDNPQLRDMGRNEANRAAYEKNRLTRFAMAGLGGLLLVVPMLIMANVPGKLASLVTTCVALLLFAGGVARFTELGGHEILGTTAAYAAVLVVFVGTSLSNQAIVNAIPA